MWDIQEFDGFHDDTLLILRGSLKTKMWNGEFTWLFIAKIGEKNEKVTYIAWKLTYRKEYSQCNRWIVRDTMKNLRGPPNP